MKYQVGDKIGRLTIVRIEREHQGTQTRNYCICQCECGNVKRIRMDSIGTQDGLTRSCGCYAKEDSSIRNKTHGQTDSPTYISWERMRSRCYNPKNPSYNHYGACGIKVCDRWRTSFENFLEDMGERPSKKHSLDRIDVNGNYEPSNCRWATDIEQQNNKKNNNTITYNGETHTVMEWSRTLGISPHGIYSRKRRGKSPEECLLQIRKKTIKHE